MLSLTRKYCHLRSKIENDKTIFSILQFYSTRIHAWSILIYIFRNILFSIIETMVKLNYILATKQ